MDNKIKLATNTSSSFDFVGNKALILSRSENGHIIVASLDITRLDVADDLNFFWRYDPVSNNFIEDKPVEIVGYLQDIPHKSFSHLLKALRDSLNELDLN